MTGHRKFKDLTKGFSQERQEQIARITAELREEMALYELRRALELSQKQLAESLKVDQPSVSKLERRTDMYVSTLRRFVEAMGGSLELVARLPQGDVRISNFSELHDENGDVAAAH